RNLAGDNRRDRPGLGPPASRSGSSRYGPRSETARVPVLAGIRAADQRISRDEDRLAAAEAGRVRVAHGLVAEPLQVGLTVPEALLEPDEVAVDTEPGTVERRLGVEAVVDDCGHELHVRLRLDEAAHHPERAHQLALPEEHSRDDRVVRPPARLDRPGDGEAGPTVLQHDSGPRR